MGTLIVVSVIVAAVLVIGSGIWVAAALLRAVLDPNHRYPRDGGPTESDTGA